MFAEWLCLTCYPKIVKGTYGKVILHGLNFHKLRFKEARTNLTLESEARKWQEKKTETNPKVNNPETKPGIGEKVGTATGKKPADPSG